MNTTVLTLQLHLKETKPMIAQVILPLQSQNVLLKDVLLFFSLLVHTVHLRTTRAFLLELKEQVDKNVTLIAPYLPYINSHLHNAVLACRAAQDKSSTPSSSFTNKQHISSRKNEHQWRLTKTNKTPGRKRKGATLK